MIITMQLVSVKMTLIWGLTALQILVTRRTNVTDLVTPAACKGHDRNVKTIILQRQIGTMTIRVRPTLNITYRLAHGLVCSSSWLLS